VHNESMKILILSLIIINPHGRMIVKSKQEESLPYDTEKSSNGRSSFNHGNY